MKIKYYSVSEVAEILGVKKRAVQARASRHKLRKRKGAYVITDKTLAKWGVENEHYSEQTAHSESEKTKRAHPENIVDGNEIGLHILPNGNKVQVFTSEEYESFENALQERKYLLKQVAELEQWRKDFFKYTSQRATLEAKDKGLIKDLEDVEDAQVMDDTDLQKHLSQKRAEVIKPKANTSEQEQGYKTDYFGWMENLKD